MRRRLTGGARRNFGDFPGQAIRHRNHPVARGDGVWSTDSNGPRPSVNPVQPEYAKLSKEIVTVF